MTLNKMSSLWMTVLLFVATSMHDQIHVADAYIIGCYGVCLGLNGNNLPSATDIINLYQKNTIISIRLFEPVPEVLRVLGDTQMLLVLGVRNEDTPTLASSVDAAAAWLNGITAMIPGRLSIPYITVGNEMVPGELAQYIPQAMINLQAALRNSGNMGTLVSTVVSLDVLATSYPPSAGAFSDAARPFMVDILRVLSQQKAPIFINVYPYFAYASNPAEISLDYALFNAQGPVVQDGPYSYSNLFDAMFDAFISAMEREGITDVQVTVAESGWPSAGHGEFTTPDIAGTYNRNFANHVISASTPKRPGVGISGFLFAMFDENLKPGDITEQHFGLFYPNMEPVYPFFGLSAATNNSTLVVSQFNHAAINNSTLIGMGCK